MVNGCDVSLDVTFAIHDFRAEWQMSTYYSFGITFLHFHNIELLHVFSSVF